MDKTLKARWIEALRGGAYPQGRGNLQQDGMYCCLGVLRDIAPSKFREVPEDENKFLRVGAFSAYLVLSQEEQKGLATRAYLVLSQEEQKGLATLNDAGVPFEMIAGLIDEAL